MKKNISLVTRDPGTGTLVFDEEEFERELDLIESTFDDETHSLLADRKHAIEIGDDDWRYMIQAALKNKHPGYFDYFGVPDLIKVIKTP